MSVFDDPAANIAALVETRRKWSQRKILAEIAALQPLPRESSPEWKDAATWARAQLVVALGDVIASRHLAAGVGPLLGKMCLGDPGEMMRGMRHSFEHAVKKDWQRLAAICEAACDSPHDGARYWATQELALLEEPSSLPALGRMLSDACPEVSTEACDGLERFARVHPHLRDEIVAILQNAPEHIRADALALATTLATPPAKG
jgi:hypothetical protein